MKKESVSGPTSLLVAHAYILCTLLGNLHQIDFQISSLVPLETIVWRDHTKEGGLSRSATDKRNTCHKEPPSWTTPTNGLEST